MKLRLHRECNLGDKIFVGLSPLGGKERPCEGDAERRTGPQTGCGREVGGAGRNQGKPRSGDQFGHGPLRCGQAPVVDDSVGERDAVARRRFRFQLDGEAHAGKRQCEGRAAPDDKVLPYQDALTAG